VAPLIHLGWWQTPQETQLLRRISPFPNPVDTYLTGNVQVASGDGIQINASNVTLDLNDFALISTTVTPTAFTRSLPL
jgi:hypothetical protein